MKMRKVLALFMVASMTAGLLAGCGGGSDSGSGSGTTTTAAAGGSGETAAAGGEAAADDKSPITFEFYNADGRNDVWDNPVGNAITEATGVTLKISYPVSSTGDPGEDIALMIANDDYPDLIYSKQAVTNLYEAGALIDMSDLIDQYGPNIKKMYGDEYDKLRWGSGDDGIYQLSYAGVRAQTLSSGGTCQIQFAVLKENDYKYPTTLDEYEKMIKDYLAAHPTTPDGLEMIGISQVASDWHWMITLGNPAGFIADAQPDNGQWLVDENNNVTYKHASDDEKEYFRWLSRMYDEGILDPQFATQTEEDYIAKLGTGRVVAITDANWHYGPAEQVLKADGKVEQTYCGLPVTLRADQKAPSLLYQGLQVGYGLGITKSCQDPVRAVKFLDYLCSDEGARLYKWGIEGVNYEIDDEGNWYRTPEEIAASQSDPDYSKKTGIGNYTGFPIYGDGAVDENGKPYTPNTRESVAAEYNEAQKAACEAWGVELLVDIFPQADEFETPAYSPLWAYATPQEIVDLQNKLDEIAWPGIVKCITEPLDNFDANWETMVETLKANGLDEANEKETAFLASKLQ